jgi:RNA polymerase sigma-70 factor (ECF subfamily)
MAEKPDKMGHAGGDPTPTELLLAWGRGEADAFDRLVPLVNRELHRIARGHMAHERPGHTLQATALVNEAYLRLIDVKRVQWQSRAHFFAMAGRVMRRILVQVVELRFFGGLTTEEAAEALHVSTDTVKRDWRFAKLWLLRELRGTAH